MQLQPGEDFPIVHILEDPSDVNTYYVQAVIRNAKTNATIATVSLTGQGSQIFSNTWHVTSDVSGLGFYVVITRTVYDDASFATPSKLYAKVSETYLVQQRVNGMVVGGGGGEDIDYKKIRKMIEEVIRTIPVPQEIDLNPIIALLKRIDKKEVELPLPVDLTPVLDAVSSTGVSIKKEIIKSFEKSLAELPAPKEQDLSFIGDIVAQAEKTLAEKVATAKQEVLDTLVSTVQAMVQKNDTPIREFLDYFLQKTTPDKTNDASLKTELGTKRTRLDTLLGK